MTGWDLAEGGGDDERGDILLVKSSLGIWSLERYEEGTKCFV